MSDLENELLGLAEDNPHRQSKKRRNSNSTRKPKSKAYVEESGDEGEEEMDMDLESEEDDSPAKPTASSSKPRSGVVAPGRNPYPLEGKYIDEDDRDQLEMMAEIERENILAGRLEEMQKFKDAQQLDAMYKMAGRAGDEDEGDDEDDEPSRKKRKHTSVTKEASKAMANLKNLRKAKDERVLRRAAKRDRRHRSDSPASDSHSTEDGEISHRDSFDISPAHASAVPKKAEEKETDLDVSPANRQEINSARLSRYELVDVMFKDRFEDIVSGAFVRLLTGETDETGRQKYRIHQVVGIDSTQSHGHYDIEYKGRNVMDNRALMCQYGKVKRLFRFADVSNGDFEEGEFSRFGLVLRADGVKPPKRSELKKKHEEIKKLRDRAMTNDEINRQVEARKKSNPLVQRNRAIIEMSSLISARNLALRRNDHDGADEINRQIEALGGDPSTGELASMNPGDTASATSEYDLRIQKINDNNKRKTKEAMAAAHLAAMQRKKNENAIVRAKQAARESASPVPLVVPTPIIPPASALKKGETPQQYVARTIDLDLGDF